MRNALRSFRASIENRGAIYLPAHPIPFGDANAVTSILGVVPEALGASLGLPGDAFGRLLAALRPPEASLDRPWAVIWVSKSRPERVRRRPQFDFGRQDGSRSSVRRFWDDLRGFPTISDQFFIDFRSTRLRRSHKIGGSKKSRVILAARLGTCGVQSLCAARVSFEMVFEQCM